MPTRLVCISDTHGRHSKLRLPEGEILIHAGDMTAQSNADEVREFLAWFASQLHPHKILVAGNHDRLFENESEFVRHLMPSGINYLEDKGCVVMGIKFWGSPVQPKFLDWAFNRSRGRDIARHWNMIPDDIDVLVTHGPAHGILDHGMRGENFGCEELRKRLQVLQPKLHVCGHIHGGFGQTTLGTTRMVNVATCDEEYRPRNPPVVVTI